MYVNVSFYAVNGIWMPVEVFTSLGKPGQCRYADLEALSRMISLSLRSGVPVDNVVRQLDDIVCHVSFVNGQKIQSIPDGIAYVLKQYEEKDAFNNWQNRISQGLPLEVLDDVSVIKFEEDSCPDCGQNTLIHRSGCQECVACGYQVC